jgi:hypothetical protein
MKSTRLLAVLLALPLVAFDCGEPESPFDRLGLGCTLHVGGGAPAEDLWCIVTAYDYSAFPDPELASSTWAFEIVAYRRGGYEVGAGGGLFLDGRPAVGATYSWDGPVASAAIASGGFDRYGGSMQAGTYELTHASSTLGNGSGEGSASVTFTAIPPAGATNAELLGVHGTLSARLPSLGGGGEATLSASF